MIVKSGATRIVFLIGLYAYKFPRWTQWRLFLHGLLANMQEVCFSKTSWPELCPVVWYIPGGWLLVMKRAEVLSVFEYEALGGSKWAAAWTQREDKVIPVEWKADSFGRLDGKIVAVDYGS